MKSNILEQRLLHFAEEYNESQTEAQRELIDKFAKDYILKSCVGKITNPREVEGWVKYFHDCKVVAWEDFGK